MSGASDPEPVSIDLGVVARSAAAVLGVVLFFTGLDNYSFAAWAAPKPLHWIVAYVVLAAALVLLLARRELPLLRSPLLWWILSFLAVTTAWALWTTGRPRVMQVLDDRYRSMAFLVAFAVVFDHPRARRAGVAAVSCAVIGGSIVYVGELLGLVHFAELEGLQRIAGRSAGFFIDPNDAALALVLGVALAIVELPRAWRLPLLVTATVGVAATFSRGALVSLAVLVACLAWRADVSRWSVAAGGLLVAASLALGGGAALSFLHAHDVLNTNTFARLRLARDDSGRIELARRAWRLFSDSPLVGNGLGASRDWADHVNSSHNQFLNLAADHGVLGLVAFPALGVALVRLRRANVPFAAALMAAGLFSHNLLDDRSKLLVIALAASRPARAESRLRERDGLPEALAPQGNRG